MLGSGRLVCSGSSASGSIEEFDLARVAPSHPRLRRDHPLARSLALACPFHDGRGSFLTDLSDYRRDIALHHNPAWITGRTGAAVRFNGSNQYATAGWGGIGGTAPRTVSAWIRTTDQGNHIVDWGLAGNGQRYSLRIDNTTRGEFRVEVHGGFIITTTGIRTGEWTHIAAVLPDGATNVTAHRLYINGRRDFISNSLPQTMSTATATSVNFARRASAADRHLAADLDDIRIYSRDLTDDEIAEIYADPWAIYRPRTRIYLFRGTPAPQPFYRPRWYAQPVGGGLV